MSQPATQAKPADTARASRQSTSQQYGVVLLSVALLYESPAETRLTVYRPEYVN